jgi:hypothetical protein
MCSIFPFLFRVHEACFPSMAFGHDFQDAVQDPYRTQPPAPTTNHESVGRPSHLAPSLVPVSGPTSAPSAAVQPRHEAPLSQASNRSETGSNDTAGVHDVLRDTRQVRQPLLYIQSRTPIPGTNQSALSVSVLLHMTSLG